MITLPDYRKAHGITQEDFAARLGIAQPTLSRLERGIIPMTVALASRIERETGGSVPIGAWVETSPAASPLAADEDAGAAA